MKKQPRPRAATPAADAVPLELIQSHIRVIRGVRVILDGDLAALYGVSTKRLLEQVRRNPARFPEDFCFQLDREELANLRSQNATSSGGHGGRRFLPYAFTEHGAIMAANVLNSEAATVMSVAVVRAFVQLRQLRRGAAAPWRPRQRLAPRRKPREMAHRAFRVVNHKAITAKLAVVEKDPRAAVGT